MRRGVDQVGDHVLVLQLRPGDALAATTLGTELGGGHGLHVARGAHGEDQLFIVDQVLDVQLARIVDHQAAPWGGVLVANGCQLVLYDRPELVLVIQDGLQLGDRLPQLDQAFLEVAAPQPGESHELHVQDVVGLDLAELESIAHQALARRGPVLGTTDQRDDVVDALKCLQQAEGYVRLVTGPAQSELAPPPDHLHLVIHVGHQEVPQVQGPWNTVDEGDRVDRERRLQRGALEEVVEDHQCRGVPLERDDDPGTALGRLVVHVGDAIDLPGVHQVADLGHDQVRAGLVRQLGHDDAAGPGAILDLGESPHANLAPAGPIGLADA